MVIPLISSYFNKLPVLEKDKYGIDEAKVFQLLIKNEK